MEWAFLVIILIFSVIFHEISHGAMANALGDNTAKQEGRLTLNPLPHLDPIGSFFLPLLLILAKSPFLIGWAKPVPINPYNLRNPKWDMAKIALAGPASNFLIAVSFSFLVRFFSLPEKFLIIFSVIIFLNILLCIFNLVPLPPLDGSKILFAFLPQSLHQVRIFMEQFSLFLLLAFLFLTAQDIIPLFYVIFSIFQILAGPQAVATLISFMGFLNS
ncbi:MAG: site-2 protease family protein [Patescibacteria group bacterium]